MATYSRPGVGRTARRALAGALCAIALAAGGANAQDDAARLVSQTPQGYSLDVHAIPVVQVLIDLGQQAGFTVEAPETFNSQITASLQDAPLDQVLRRLLRDENYIIVYRGGVQKTSLSGGEIDRIVLLSQAGSGGAKPPGGGSPLAGPGGAGHPGPRGGLQAPPLPGAAPDEEGGDIATRSARARARAEARRTALAEGQSTGDGDAAQMVPQPEDFNPPPPVEEHAAPHGDVPGVDVPPEDGEE
jgi:hypothetical protein